MSAALLLRVCLILAALSGCRKPSEASAERKTAPAPAGSSTRPGLQLSGELQAEGLHVRSGTWRGGPDSSALWGFTDIALDLARTRLAIARDPGGAALGELLPPTGLAIVNGGYFEADFRPSTWLKSNGVELAPKSDTSKGGVLALVGAVAYVGPFKELRFDPELAVQSFPLLVEPDFLPGIHRDDGRRAARTVACLVHDELHLMVISAPRGEGPTLFEVASLLRAPPPAGLGCRVALNLDGGPSSGVHFAPPIAARSRPPLAKVAYALAILPR